MTIKTLHELTDPKIKIDLDFEGCSYPLERDTKNPLFIACSSFIVDQITTGTSKNTIEAHIKTIPAME